jgi:catechol 2,3-dioxygenase-like lactoylglutathione lyase family enzyme
MKPRITILTLGVTDLQRSLAFYRDGLGWPTKGIVGTEFEHGAVVFFDLESGLRLALYPREYLAKDATVSAPLGIPSISLGHNVRSRSEVDDVIGQARSAGAAIVKAPTDTFWGGYAGYFQDLDGYMWEVAWNPDLMPAS